MNIALCLINQTHFFTAKLENYSIIQKYTIWSKQKYTFIICFLFTAHVYFEQVV